MSTPLNNIPSIQNTPRFIEYLSASSTVYGRAKKIIGMQVLLTVALPVLLSIMALKFPSLQEGVALYGIVISLLDLMLIDALQEDQKREAAKMQEMFDCALMEIPWNAFKVGDHPAPELIRKSSQNYKKAPKRDWYSVHIASLPLVLARIALQRSNVFWDADLRHRYSGLLLAVVILLAVVAVGVGFQLKMPLNTFVLITASLLPTFQWLVREYRKQRQSVGLLDRLKQYAEETWNAAIARSLDETTLAIRCRELQDEIFMHRSTNQPVPNWLFFWLRSADENAMNAGIEEMVRQAREKQLI